MTAETGGLPFVDPKKILSRPFYHYESIGMHSAPTLELLQWVPTLSDEAGFVLRNGVWVLIKGDKNGIPSYLVSRDSDVLIHSHPVEEDEENHPSWIPNLRDFLNAWPGIRNFITSTHGLTRYWSITDDRTTRELEAETMRPRMTNATGTDLLAYYAELEAKFELTNWREIDENRLSMFLRR